MKDTALALDDTRQMFGVRRFYSRTKIYGAHWLFPIRPHND